MTLMYVYVFIVYLLSKTEEKSLVYPLWRDFQIDLNSSSSAPLLGKERRLMMGGIKGIGKTWEEAVRPMLPDMQVH